MRKITQALLDRLTCPACRVGKLVRAGEVIACQGCRHEHRERTGLFDLDVLPDAEPSKLQRSVTT